MQDHLVLMFKSYHNVHLSYHSVIRTSVYPITLALGRLLNITLLLERLLNISN